MTGDRSRPLSCFREGRLDQAIESAGELVRRDPRDAMLRVELAEYLVFASALERADTVLAAAEAVDATLGLIVAEFRQLIRAASSRQRVANDGKLPEFIGEPTPSQTALLRALVASRAGDRVEAAKAAAEAESLRPARPGVRQGMEFDDFRDADDLIGGNVEVFTTTGRFFWIDGASVISMALHKPSRPRDLIWRRCTMSVRNGPDGDVYLPALYDVAPGAADDVRLGRTTEWDDDAPVRGRGQRVLILGDEGIPFHELGSVDFAS